MPLGQKTRRTLAVATTDLGFAKQIADVIDAGSGTLSAGAARLLSIVLADPFAAASAVTAINAGTALNQGTLNRLIVGLADANAANDIQAVLSA